eukprot:347715-Chlamydomonas_euryale.AAC.1
MLNPTPFLPFPYLSGHFSPPAARLTSSTPSSTAFFPFSSTPPQILLWQCCIKLNRTPFPPFPPPSFRPLPPQILLQQRGIKLNPITTLYYIAPACFGFLLIPFSFIEAPRLFGFSPVDFEVTVNVPVLLASAASAFCLNMAVFLLIGKSSALTMNVAGVIKDWLLILLSVMMYASPVSGLQLGGYALAFGGVCWYNYLKYKSMQAKAADSGKLSSDEKAPLMEQKEMSSMQGSKA